MRVVTDANYTCDINVALMPTNVHELTGCGPSRSEATMQTKDTHGADYRQPNPWARPTLGNGGVCDDQTCDDAHPDQCGARRLV